MYNEEAYRILAQELCIACRRDLPSGEHAVFNALVNAYSQGAKLVLEGIEPHLKGASEANKRLAEVLNRHP